MHTVVDNCNSTHQCARTMSNRHSFSTLLQLSCCIRQISGKPCRPCFDPWNMISDRAKVLASPHNLPLFRTLITRSRLPCFLSYSILTITGGVIRAITSTFLVVIAVRNDMSHLPISSSIDAVPWPSALFHTRLHMVEAQSRY